MMEETGGGEKKLKLEEKATATEETKKTEYEIFQSLTAVVPKPPRKRIPCPECGVMIPPNTLKRHLLKHAKMAEKSGGAESQGNAGNSGPELSGQEKPQKKRVECDKCGLKMAPNVIKRHLLKHKKSGGAGKKPRNSLKEFIYSDYSNDDSNLDPQTMASTATAKAAA